MDHQETAQNKDNVVIEKDIYEDIFRFAVFLFLKVCQNIRWL